MALYDRNLHNHPPMAFHGYKAFFRCEITGGSSTTSSETDGVDFFALNALPPLSVEQRTQFVQDGYVRVSGLISTDLVFSTRAGLYGTCPLHGKVGDVIFTHYFLVHSGCANQNAHIRVGLNTALMPDLERTYPHKDSDPQPGWMPLDWSLRTDTPDRTA